MNGTRMEKLESTSDCQGFPNPHGLWVGSVGVRVGVEISVPLKNPYPQESAGVRGIYRDKIFCTYHNILVRKTCFFS